MLVMPGPWVIGVLANNLWRVGGVSHGLTVNQFTTQPFINLNLPNAWSLVTAPIITSNWSAQPDQRWTVPLGGGVAKITRIDKQALSVGMQYYHNVNRPRTNGSDEMRFQISLLYPVANP